MCVRERQTDRETERQRDRQTETETDRLRDRDRNGEKESRKGRANAVYYGGKRESTGKGCVRQRQNENVLCFFRPSFSRKASCRQVTKSG